jgi:hypothetical protein
MSNNKVDRTEEVLQNGGVDQHPAMLPPSLIAASGETFQEGVAPVQAFTTPVVAGSEIRVREGRPPRAPQ